MKIRRKAEDYGLPAGIIEIELTPEELEQAFRIKEKEYRLEDVRSIIHDAYNDSEQISENEYLQIKDNKEFHEAVLREYDKRFSCNIPENTTWEETLKAVLKETEFEGGEERC